MASRSTFGFVLLGVLAASASMGACGGGGDDNPGAPPGDTDAGSGGDATLFGGQDGQAQKLTIDPVNPTLDVTTPGVTQQFKALLNGQPTGATWTIDVAAIGTIDNNGLFKASGQMGGTTRVTAQVGNLQAQTTLTVRLHFSENPGNVDPGTQGKLQGGGNADPNFKWLYPYDKTVFPRGLLPPTLMFASNADAYYVHVTSNALDYKGFFAGTSSRVDWSPAVWKTITGTAGGAGDPVKVEVTKIAGGAVSGPVAESWVIAPGSLKGTVYYNSYSSQLAGNTGAVLRIKPGAAAPDVLAGGCHVCHAVSADGSTLISSRSDYQSGEAFDLKNGGTSIRVQNDSKFTFGGVYPDGTMVMTNAALSGSWPPNVPGQEQGPRASMLIETKTGNQIAAAGWDGVIGNAITPAFSPDGKKIAFNHYDKDQGHTLSVMSFDKSSKAFSGLVDLVSDPAKYLAWPTFTPDGDWVIFHSDSRQDYATWQGAKADLLIAHIPSKTVARLDALDGYANGQVYLPYGEAADAHMNYEPTMLPVAVGGYYWVVFTSRRNYGNMIASGTSQDNTDRKKLWVAAIDINVANGEQPPHSSAYDASHPAFYLPGQELPSGNMRGFWALDPCKQNGNTCDTGDECCTGYCRQTNQDGGTVFACVPPPSGCANEFEHCNVTADCCGASQGYSCINGHCARPAPR